MQNNSIPFAFKEKLVSQPAAVHYSSLGNSVFNLFLTNSVHAGKPAMLQYSYPEFRCIGDHVHELIEQMSAKYQTICVGINGLCFVSDDVFVSISEYDNVKSETTISGAYVYSHNRKLALEVQKTLSEFCGDAQCTIDINWVLDAKGTTQSLTTLYNPLEFSESVYPYIAGGAESYIDRYLNSSATMLIIIGPPGTGKTSFIRHLLYKSKFGAFITYDEDVLNTDSVFSTFLGSHRYHNFIIEDADNFLRPRTEGNSMMSRFLNIGDGLVKVKNKKMIFSTNLPSVAHIDPALTRPGRCFDVLHFRELTYDEATVVADENDVTLTEKKTYSLGDIFNCPQPLTVTPRSFGFIS